MFLATLEEALFALHKEYKDDPGGYGHLQVELRTMVCGERVDGVVVGDEVVACAT